MERQGSGLEKIRQFYACETNYTNDMEPVFCSSRSEFIVKLSNLNYKELYMDSGLNGALITNEHKVLEYLKYNSQVTQIKIAEDLAISRITVFSACSKKLQDNGMIEYIGSRKKGHWLVLYQ